MCQGCPPTVKSIDRGVHNGLPSRSVKSASERGSARTHQGDSQDTKLSAFMRVQVPLHIWVGHVIMRLRITISSNV